MDMTPTDATLTTPEYSVEISGKHKTVLAVYQSPCRQSLIHFNETELFKFTFCLAEIGRPRPRANLQPAALSLTIAHYYAESNLNN